MVNSVREKVGEGEAISDRASLFVSGGEVVITTSETDAIIISDEDAVEIKAPVYTFAGLQIAPGPLYFNGTSYEIKDNWNYSSYSTVSGKEARSTYFSFNEMGKLFEKEGFDVNNDGSIGNLLDPFDGWRLPTRSEWDDIFGNSRIGSTVNGVSNKLYAWVYLDGISYTGNYDLYGLLLFPDNEIITGKTLITPATTLTLLELDEYIAQGCAYLPASGLGPVNSESGEPEGQFGDKYGYYMSSSCLYEDFVFYLWFYNTTIDREQYTRVGEFYSVRLVKPVE